MHGLSREESENDQSVRHCNVAPNSTTSKRTMVKKTSSSSTVPDSVKEQLEEAQAENARLRQGIARIQDKLMEIVSVKEEESKILARTIQYVVEKSREPAGKTKPLSVEVRDSRRVDDHTEYLIKVKYFSAAAGHFTSKRFSEFQELHQRVLRAAEIAARPEATCGLFSSCAAAPDQVNLLILRTLRATHFPSKRILLSKFDPALIEERKEDLESYLNHLLDVGKKSGRGSQLRAIISDWIGLHREDEDTAWSDERTRPLIQS